MDPSQSVDLSLLRRLDPCVSAILASSPKVAVFKRAAAATAWKRCDIEGALYIVSRAVASQSRHCVIVLNRKTPANFFKDITVGGLRLGAADRFITFQDPGKHVTGVRFSAAGDIQRVLKCMAAIIGGESPAPKLWLSPPPLSASPEKPRRQRGKATTAAETLASSLGSSSASAKPASVPYRPPRSASLAQEEASAAGAADADSTGAFKRWNGRTRRDSTAAIARFLLEQSGRSRLEFTEDEFMAAACRKWTDFCSHLRPNQSWKYNFIMLLKSWEGSFGLNILVVGPALYAVEVAVFEPPASSLGRRRRHASPPGRDAVPPAPDDSSAVAERPAKVGRMSGQFPALHPTARWHELAAATAAVARRLLGKSPSPVQFTEEVFLSTAENNWAELCGDMTMHHLWKFNFKKRLADWNRQFQLNIRVVGDAEYSVEVCSSVVVGNLPSMTKTLKATSKGKVASRVERFDSAGRLLGFYVERPTRREVVAAVVHRLFQKHGCSFESFTAAEFWSEVQEHWELFCWPFVQGKKHGKSNFSRLLRIWEKGHCGLEIVERSANVFVLKDFQPDKELLPKEARAGSSAGHTPPGKSVATVTDNRIDSPPKSDDPQLALGGAELVDMNTLQSNSVDRKELQGMDGEQLSLTVAACMINFNEDARFLLTNLASCLRTVFGHLAISGDAIVDFPAELLIPMVLDGLKDLDVYKSFGESVTKVLEWRFEKVIAGLRQG